MGSLLVSTVKVGFCCSMVAPSPVGCCASGKGRRGDRGKVILGAVEAEIRIMSLHSQQQPPEWGTARGTAEGPMPDNVA